MKKETAQSIGLRRWRVVEFSSKASAKTRLCSAILGGGKTTLLLGLPPVFTSSRKRYCSLIMMPPKNVACRILQANKKSKSSLKTQSK
jgi:hypothetical protein